MKKAVDFKNRQGETLRGFVYKPKNYDQKKGLAAVLLHGFPGSCDGPRSKRLCRAFEKKNCLALRFDFSGSDTSDGKFEDKLISKEVAETKIAIDFLEKNYGFDGVILIGHSTGAIVAALYAYKDKRVKKLVLSGSVPDLKNAARWDFKDWQVREFWTKGYITYKRKGKWTNNKRILKRYYDEFFKLSIPKTLKKYKKPLLVIHGEKDVSVPLSEGLGTYRIANRPKKLVIIKGTDHGYKGKLDEHVREVIKFSLGKK